jgi:hypothetical protein
MNGPVDRRALLQGFVASFLVPWFNALFSAPLSLRASPTTAAPPNQASRIEIHPLPRSTALEPAAMPRPLDDDPAHGLGRRSEEMAATVLMRLGFSTDQSQITIVNERRSLMRLPWALLS